MHTSSKTFLLAGCGALLLAGCSSSSGGLFGSDPLTTQSISTSPAGTSAVAAVPKVDPACYSLAQRIETLRRDGLTERLEKAASGKSSTVSIKRQSLAQAAELDRANAEFQAKCSTLPRPLQTAAQQASAGASSAQVVPATAPRTTSAAIAPPVVQQP